VRKSDSGKRQKVIPADGAEAPIARPLGIYAHCLTHSMQFQTKATEFGTGDGIRVFRPAFTLVEVVISLAVVGLMVAGTLTGYMMAIQRAEWSGYSLAAQSLALQQLEQTRASKWDPDASPAVDQLVSANFPARTNVLDVLNTGTNVIWATNFTTIQTVSTSPPLRYVRVDCVWRPKPGSHLFTNTVATYRAPDS
jgi:prepilin-type N-terminal cleavage/methylation domain-containing protein